MEPTKYQEQPSDYANRALFGGVQALGGGVASRYLSRGLNFLKPHIRKQVEGMGSVAPPEFQTGSNTRVKEVLQKILNADKNTPRDFTVVPINEAIHAAADPSDKKFYFSAKNPATTIAHEVGHAAPKSRLALGNQYLAALGNHAYGMALPTALALTDIFNKGEETNPVAKAAPYVGGLLLASQLLEEGRANVRGAELLSKAGWKLPLKNRIGMFLPTATYLAKALPLIGVPIGISAGIRAYNKKRPHPSELVKGYSPQALGELPASAEELEEKWLSEPA